MADKLAAFLLLASYLLITSPRVSVASVPYKAPTTPSPYKAPTTPPPPPTAATTTPPTPTYKAPPPAAAYPPTPTPTPTPAPNITYVDIKECPKLCDGRCALHSRPNHCHRVCGTCCARCRCVPPGTAGNREMCGTCYTDMTTHRNQTKCP